MGAIRWKKGDSFHIECTEYTAGWASARDLTDCTLTCSWKHVDDGTYFDATVTVTSATAGIYTVTATAAQTAALALGLYAVDIRIEDGSEVGSSDTFYIHLDEAITNAA
jgi:hypothetical protein